MVICMSPQSQAIKSPSHTVTGHKVTKSYSLLVAGAGLLKGIARLQKAFLACYNTAGSSFFGKVSVRISMCLVVLFSTLLCFSILRTRPVNGLINITAAFVLCT